MSLREAGADPGERLHRRIALAAALLLNLAFLAELAHRMRPPVPPSDVVPRERQESRDVMHVRLIDVVVPAAPLSPSAADVPARTEAPPVHPPSRSLARVARERPAAAPPDAAPDVSAPSAASPPQFFDANGQVRLPEAVVDSSERPFPRRPSVPAEGNPFVHRDVLPYEPTRFDKYFPPVRETLGGELVRKATVQRTIRTSDGMQITCSWMLIFGGCTWGYASNAPIEELKAMRVELPPLKPMQQTPAGTGASSGSDAAAPPGASR